MKSNTAELTQSPATNSAGQAAKAGLASASRPKGRARMPEAELIVHRDNDVTIVELRPDTFGQAAAVEQTARDLFDLIEKGGAKKILLDFASVNFLSSQALGVLLTVRLKAAKVGATLVLANVRARFGEILALTNLDKMFAIFDDRAAAIAHLRK